MEILFAFEETGAAIAAEQALMEANIPVKVMSLPSAIKAGCGLVLRVPPQDAVKAASHLSAAGFAGYTCYTRTVENGQSRYEAYAAKL